MEETIKQLPFVKGLEGIAVAISSISHIDGKAGRLIYRGFPVEDLAQNSSFEEVVFLLWRERLPSSKELEEFKERLKEERELSQELIEILKLLPQTSHPMDVLRTAVSAMGIFHRKCNGKGFSLLDDAISILSRIPTVLATFHMLRSGKSPIPPSKKLDHASNFLYMMNGEPPEMDVAKIFDAILILHAEQEMNASTFAATVTASTLSDIYSAITSAIGTLKGPIHGGASEKVMEVLDSIEDLSKVEEFVERKISAGEKIMGFGHRIYKTYDPRAVVLKSMAKKLVKSEDGKKRLETAMKLEEAIVSRLGSKGIYPNVDFYSGILYSELGIPKDFFTAIFAMARCAGWAAHIMEYTESNRIFRPRAIYEGPKDLNYMEEKKKVG
ncbi:MAG: citrate synthase [Thermotogota bacterium]|nr:citrate synthase [Thermotogota bacterium]